MRFLRFAKRNIIIIVLLALLCGAVFTGNTAAYSSGDAQAAETEESAQKASSTRINVKILEKNADGSDYGKAVRELIPGTSTDKIVTVKNTGNRAAWIRVEVTKELTLAATAEGTADLSLITLNINTDDWIDGEDGYYYYKQPLEKGKETTPLFTAVSFDAVMDNRYQGCTFDIGLTAQAVEYDDEIESVTESSGWPT